MQVRCDGIFYDVWKIDDDTSNILGLFSAIGEYLKSLEKDATTMLDVTAHIRGGECEVKVPSDTTMMQMLNLNSNPSDVILLEVRRISCPPLAVSDEEVHEVEKVSVGY